MTVTVQLWDDPTSWNQFVSSTPHGHFQQSWEWGDLAPELGGRAVRIAALVNGELTGAAQVFVSRLGPTGATQLYVPRGPAVREPSVEILGPIFDRITLLAHEVNAAGLRVEASAPAWSTRWKETMHALSLRETYPPSQPRSAWMLDISPPDDVLLERMKQKTRYNIRLAGRKGVTICDSGPADLDAFYDLLRETSLRDDFFIQSKDVYAHMFDSFAKNGDFCLLLARHEGQVIAAVTLVRFGPTCWYLHGASSNTQRNLMAPYLLQWEAIKQAKRWGCRLYDFRGVPDVLREDQDMYGVYRFKEGFGGYHFTTLHTWTRAYRPLLFGSWQLYFRGRFELTALLRRRKGLLARQFA